MEYDVSRGQPRDICRAVVVFFLTPDINRQLLFINIRRTPVHIRRTQRIVRERGRITARKRQRIVNGASRRVCGCKCIFTCLRRGILGAVRSRDCQMNLVGIPRNDARQLLICHRIDEVFVVLIERRIPVILLDEVCRELRRKVARRNRARRMAHIITRPRKVEVRRIDADTVVDLVRSNNIGAIVRRRQELNIRQVDVLRRNNGSRTVAEFQRTRREVVFGMFQIVIRDMGRRISPDNLVRTVILLRRRVNLNVEIIPRYRTLRDGSLTIGSIRDLVVPRVWLCIECIL